MRRVLMMVLLLSAATACAARSGQIQTAPVTPATNSPITASMTLDLVDPATGQPYKVAVKFVSEVERHGLGWKYSYEMVNTSTKPIKVEWIALAEDGPSEQINKTFVSLLPPVIELSSARIYHGDNFVASGAAPAYVPRTFSRNQVVELFKQTGRSSVYFSDGDQFIYLVQFFPDATQCGSGFSIYGLRLRANQMSLRDLPPGSIEIGRAHAQSETSNLMIQNENIKFGDMKNWSCQDMYSPLNEIARLNGKITAADRADFDRIMSLTALSLQKLGPRSK